VAIPVIEYIETYRLITSKPLFLTVSAATITLSATLLTLPVLIYSFGYISTVSVITNLLISYAVTLALSISVIALTLNFCFPFLAKFLFAVCDSLVKYINAVINLFGSLPFSVVRLPLWTAFLAVLLIILIFYCLLACKKRLDMIELNEIINKKLEKRGGNLKWQLFLKRI